MSERGQFRGGRGGGGRGRGGGADGGGRGGRGGANNAQTGGEQARPKKENILDLNKYMDKEIMVKFNGGREGTKRPATPLAIELTYSSQSLAHLRATTSS